MLFIGTPATFGDGTINSPIKQQQQQCEIMNVGAAGSPPATPNQQHREATKHGSATTTTTATDSSFSKELLEHGKGFGDSVAPWRRDNTAAADLMNQQDDCAKICYLNGRCI